MEQDNFDACEKWKRIVADLRDVEFCNNSAHALASEPPGHGPILQGALRCVPASEIIEGTIYAYRDWTSQGYCDLILAQFDLDEIIAIFSHMKNPHELMKLGVLGIVSDRDDVRAARMARTLNTPDAMPWILDAVAYELRHDCDFWKEISLRLHHPQHCVTAVRTLALGLPETTENDYPRMWRLALRCLPASEIMAGVIFAYRNRAAHADCHRVLAQFPPDEVLSQFGRLENPDAEIKLGLLNFFEEHSREHAVRLAEALDSPEETFEVRDAIRYVMRESNENSPVS